jgi:hypothetical protein
MTIFAARMSDNGVCCKPCATQTPLVGYAGKVMVLEALLKAIRSSEPTDKVVLVSNYTGQLQQSANKGTDCLCCSM